MQRLLAALAHRRAATAFPGRVRIVAAPGREAVLADLGWAVEWPGADAAEAIAGLAGAALWEAPRGGLATAVIDGGDLDDGAAMPALLTAARLAAPSLLAVIDPTARQRALVAAAGWTWGDGDAVSGPVAMAVAGPGARSATATAIVRGDWAPVRLFAVRDWRARTGDDPLADLAALAAQEPRLLLPHAVTPWRDLPATPSLLAAIAVAAGEGRRVCWHVPSTLDLRDAAPVLRRLAARGRGLTLVVDGFDSASLAFWATLPAWWVACPGDAGEFRALLARGIGSADLVVVARPAPAAGSPWPAGTAHEPGSGRWLAGDADATATIVCAGGLAVAALDAREALAAMGRAVAVYQPTSLQPLPEHDLQAAAARGPLVVADDGDPALGLAGAIARLGIAVVPVGHGPLAADLAAAVRAAG
jgi:hypothetical protein